MKKEAEENQGRERVLLRDITLEEIMRPCVSVTADTTEREALELMLQNDLPCIPVVDGNEHLIGCVTDKDILASVLPPYLALISRLSFISETADDWIRYATEAANRPVREVMRAEGQSPVVELEHSEIEAAHKMANEDVSALVVTRGAKVVGTVTRADLCAAIVGLKPG